MLKYYSFLICVVYTGYTTAAYVDSLKKCAVKDNECFRKLYENVIKEDVSSKGIPELSIPPVDPIELYNITVSVFGVADIVLVKGTATGVSACVFDFFAIDLEKESGHQENTCSFTIEGQYKLIPNVIMKTFLGDDSIYGDGHAKIELNDLHMKFDFPVYVQKRDGETYLKADYKNIQHEYEVKGNTVFAVDNIYLAGVETSETIVPFMNQNHKFIMKTAAKPFIEKAKDIYLELAGKFFDVVPTKHYITDDLNSIAKD